MTLLASPAGAADGPPNPMCLASPAACVAAPIVGGAVNEQTKALCRDEPTADDPHGGVGELLAPKPVGPTLDPFKGDPPPSIYQRYGYGGMFVPVYDLGCIKGAGAGPLNTWSNLHLRGQVWVDALASFFHRAGQTKAWWDALDPVVETSQVLAQRILWGPRGLFALAIAVLALVAIRRGRNGEPSVVARLAMIGLGVFFLGHLTAFHGVETTHYLRDRLVPFTSAFDGGAYDVESDVEARQLRYRTWSAAMFGDADSPVAQEYGPKMLDCFAFRWDDPQTGDKRTEKQECVHKLMDELSEKHSVEADYAHGAKTSEQWFTTGMGFWWGSLPVALWKISAGLAGIVLFMTVTMAVPAIAFLAPVALFKPREVLWPIFKKLSSLLGMAVGCSVVAQLVAGAEGVLLGAAAIPWLLRLVFCVAVVFAFWILGRSLRRPLNGWTERKVAGGAEKAVKGALRGAEFAAAISAGIPPGIIENMGKMPKGLKGQTQGQGQQQQQAAAPAQQRRSWVAPPLGLPAAGQTIPAGRPPVAWAHEQTGDPRLSLGAGPTRMGPATLGLPTGAGKTTRDPALVDPYWVRPEKPIPAGLALPSSSGVTHDPVIHGEKHRRLTEAIGRRAADPFPAAVGDFDRKLTGAFVADGKGKPLVGGRTVLDVPGWVAPKPGGSS